MFIERRATGRNWHRGVFIAALVFVIFSNHLAAYADSYAEHLELGMKLYKQDDFDEAIVELQKAKALSPRHPIIRLGLARSYEKLRRYSEAESEFQELIALEPTNLANTVELAFFYMEQGKYQNANSLFQDVLNKDRSHTDALWGAGISSEGMDNLGSAQEYYQKLIKEHPGTHQAADAQVRLKRISGAEKAISSNQFFPIDNDLGIAGLGWWNLRHMPLHVYVDSGDGVQGYRPEMRTFVQKALDNWSLASRGAITFILDGYDGRNESEWARQEASKSVLSRIQARMSDMPHDPVPCDIHIHWTDGPELRKSGALGLSWTSRIKDGNPILNKAHIWLATNVLADGKPLPQKKSYVSPAILESQDRMLEEVTTHEFGHILGLPHSSNPNDIMCSGVYGLNARDLVESRHLSPRDLKSLAEHYNNFEGTGIQLATKSSSLMQESSPGTAPPAAGGSGEAAPPPKTEGETPSTASATPPGTDETKPSDAPDEKEKADEDKPKESEEAQEKPKENKADKAEFSTQSYSALKDAMFDLNTKKYDQCLEKLNRILARNPNQPDAHYLRAVAYVMLRQYSNAANDYRKVVQLSPNSDLGRKAREGLRKLSF